MKFTEDLATQHLNTITHIDNDYIVVQKKKINTPHFIAPDALVKWDVQGFGEITSEHIALAKKLRPEVIIFGTGDTHLIPSKAILKALVAIGIGYEIMTTPAACRTYNILVAEDRRVVAGLII